MKKAALILGIVLTVCTLGLGARYEVSRIAATECPYVKDQKHLLLEVKRVADNLEALRREVVGLRVSLGSGDVHTR